MLYSFICKHTYLWTHVASCTSIYKQMCKHTCLNTHRHKDTYNFAYRYTINRFISFWTERTPHWSKVYFHQKKFLIACLLHFNFCKPYNKNTKKQFLWICFFTIAVHWLKKKFPYILESDDHFYKWMYYDLVEIDFNAKINFQNIDSLIAVKLSIY